MVPLAIVLAATVHAFAQPQPVPKADAVPPPPDVAAPPADAAKTSSGLMSKVIQSGNGSARPTAEDFVTVHYTGWTTDGKMFDSSYARSAPSTFPVNRVIKGWGRASS